MNDNPSLPTRNSFEHINISVCEIQFVIYFNVNGYIKKPRYNYFINEISLYDLYI